MRVLIGCEFSGRVRDAFLRRGHDAISCDLIPSEAPGPHIQGDIFDVLGQTHCRFDLGIFFPSCRRLAVSGARWFKDYPREQEEAVQFVRRLMACHIAKVALENPIGVLSTKYRKPDQIIQPWQFGHGETKATCLWLGGGLPLLEATDIVAGRFARVHREPPSPDRWKNRSRTYEGIAQAMADQWGT